MTANVIGVDWSLSATGVAGLTGATFTLHPPTKDCVARLEWLFREAQCLAADLERNDILVFEEPFVMGPGRGSSTLDLGEMYGVVKLALRKWRARIVWVPPAVLKMYATGKGNATKPDLRAELIKRNGLDLRDDNQVDAWWLRAMGLDHIGIPPLELPATHRRALDRVTWPGGG